MFFLLKDYLLASHPNWIFLVYILVFFTSLPITNYFKKILSITLVLNNNTANQMVVGSFYKIHSLLVIGLHNPEQVLLSSNDIYQRIYLWTQACTVICNNWKQMMVTLKNCFYSVSVIPVNSKQKDIVELWQKNTFSDSFSFIILACTSFILPNLF